MPAPAGFTAYDEIEMRTGASVRSQVRVQIASDPHRAAAVLLLSSASLVSRVRGPPGGHHLPRDFDGLGVFANPRGCGGNLLSHSLESLASQIWIYRHDVCRKSLWTQKDHEAISLQSVVCGISIIHSFMSCGAAAGPTSSRPFLHPYRGRC